MLLLLLLTDLVKKQRGSAFVVKIMKAEELRKKFLNFFASKGHKIIPSASLVPQDDPTVLFTTAGMHPLIPYLLGQPHPLGKRLASVQKCLRTGDIEEVGDESHLTFFEMLGNWSLGDYFKKQAINWSFEFLITVLGLDKNSLAVSVFKGDAENNILRDNESAKIWQSLGIKPERIAYLGREDNWWGPAGKTGPCGPDTEIFVWTGKSPAPEQFDPEDKNWLEVWNNVFMEYNKTKEGKLVPLEQKNVDTGMGLERMLTVLDKKETFFETEVFKPLVEKIKSLTSLKSKDNKGIKDREAERAIRIIADHMKAAVFILAEGVTPSNTEQGYVLRRLIRRAIRFAGILGVNKGFGGGLAEVVISLYRDCYPELAEKQEFILREIAVEEESFNRALTRGLNEIRKIGGKEINAEQAFDLYQTYGFPLEMTKEIAREKGMIVDEKGFQKKLREHQELSRQGAAKRFQSGLADYSEQTIKYHTATHLLQAALRRILGEEVRQMGSNITAERLRFDFSFGRKMTPDELKKVEDLVNSKIKENLEVKKEEMLLNEALQSGALSFFRERYPEKVSVYTIWNPKNGEVFSKEICAGPHVKHTAEIGRLKIVKEEASSRGIRRIKAVLE